MVDLENELQAELNDTEGAVDRIGNDTKSWLVAVSWVSELWVIEQSKNSARTRRSVFP